ncbi:MAG TPA: hypothetical protein VN181_09240 [Thermoanaerobaculia bacterium]|nr:hypothetical protein [Thermoanaerobaculia bacterium]
MRLTPSRSGEQSVGERERKPTLLQRYLVSRGIPSAHVEREAHVSAKQMARWRFGRSDIRRKKMVRILGAVRKLAKDTDIRMEELFDLDPDNPENWSE